MREQFLQFLKDKGIAIKFNEEYDQESEAIERDESLDSFLNKEEPLYYVARAFFWASTKDGKEYWENIHWNWERIVIHSK